jgi:hypothetical protein
VTPTRHKPLPRSCQPTPSIVAAMKSEPTPPMTLGNAAKAELRLIVWRRAAVTRSTPIPSSSRHRAETPVLDWRERLDLVLASAHQPDFIRSRQPAAPETLAARRPDQRPLRPLHDRLRPVAARGARIQRPCRFPAGTGDLGVLTTATHRLGPPIFQFEFSSGRRPTPRQLAKKGDLKHNSGL